LTEGAQTWDYLYVDDAVEAIYRVCVTPGAVGVFNLASGSPHSVREIAETIRDMIDLRLPLGFGELPYAPDQIMRLEADISKLVSCTGWKPKTDLRTGLRRTVEWYRRQLARETHT
jgi:nucleoside-diphosphate-sugar epimerase